MELREILRSSKIDFSQCVLIRDEGSSFDDTFDIKPRDFLRFAKEDFKETSIRNLINSVTNSKRAIDCQADLALRALGIKYDAIPNAANCFIEQAESGKEDIPLKFKLLNALRITPGVLISKYRTIRNRLEHYYEKPTKEDVVETIELAELFISAIENRVKIFENKFYITDESDYDRNFDKNLENYLSADRFYDNYIKVDFDVSGKTIEITVKNSKNMIENKITINSIEREYYVFLRLMLTFDDGNECEESMKLLLKLIGHPIPSKNVHLIER